MKTRTHFLSALFTLALVLASAAPAAAQTDRLCDPANEDCRSILIGYMDKEWEAIDIAFWFMEDARYTAAIERALDRNVRVRVLMDPRANVDYPLNAQRLAEIQADGVPMRKRLTSYILHWKMMLFRGQGIVEFSGANYSANALRYEPTTGPYVNYVDEAVYFTSDQAIVNSFREKFDDFWVDTVNWANYANITGPLTREEPDNTYVQAAEMNFPPEQNYRTRSLQRYNASRLASNARGIDVIMYRITDQQHTQAMIAAEARGVPVRLITEQAQYRLVSRMWHSWNVDQLYMAGIEVRDRAHAGLNHQKSVILHDQDLAAGDQRLVIFGSSNWTSPSAGGQVEHNMFTSRPAMVSWFIDQFERKWNNLAPVDETKPFVPLSPDAPKTPMPANAATGVATSLTLQWNGGPWAHLYDLYLGTTPDPPLFASHTTDVNLRELPSKTATSGFKYVLPQGTLQPGTKYYWRVVGKTMALKTKSSPTAPSAWTFTTEGGPPPPPPPPPPGGDDIVLYASKASLKVGSWSPVSDSSAAGGARLQNANAGVPKVTTASGNPAHYFEMTFEAEAGRPYRLWIRGKALSNSWGNDSVFVQFSGSVTQGGSATWRIGTASATEYNLEDCSGCGVSNWGWQDNGWGVGVMGPPVYFANTGPQTIRIQVREDGLGIDQIVLSPETFLNTAPGALKNDGTILPESSGEGAAPEPDDIVVHVASEALLAGAWQTQNDTTAAGGVAVRHPNAGAAKRSTALAEPIDYFDVAFEAEADRPYRLWMRSKADDNSWANDSVFVQFSGAVAEGGAAVWRIGTTSASEMNLEDCSGCGLASWGWQDNGWGVGVMGPLVRFTDGGPQILRVQTREDGLSIDQIVLSPSTYLEASPGEVKNDTTILSDGQ